jgi:hypothetical protein
MPIAYVPCSIALAGASVQISALPVAITALPQAKPAALLLIPSFGILSHPWVCLGHDSIDSDPSPSSLPAKRVDVNGIQKWTYGIPKRI